ncbi:MAG: hypothetical protein EG825_00375 [Rhodocyclaceae bacterium]|nr:hypothetical protein [Rhodocyclaceae bacterium]
MANIEMAGLELAGHSESIKLAAAHNPVVSMKDRVRMINAQIAEESDDDWFNESGTPAAQGDDSRP